MKKLPNEIQKAKADRFRLAIVFLLFEFHSLFSGLLHLALLSE